MIMSFIRCMKMEPEMRKNVLPRQLTVRTAAEADHLMEPIRMAATNFKKWATVQSGDPLDMLRRMKF